MGVSSVPYNARQGHQCKQKYLKERAFSSLKHMNTVGHTGIYACGDHVKLKLSQQCSGRWSKNPTTLVVWSVNRKIHENVKHTAENSKETASPSAEYHEEELTFTEALALVICTDECLRSAKEGKEKAVEAILANLDHPESDDFKAAAMAYKNAAALEKMFSESYILCRK